MNQLLVFLCWPALVLSQIRWDDLKVTWGFDPTNPNLFKSQPRTEQEALSKGFVKVSECNDIPSFRGRRYVKDNDYALVLLFDINGFIAGVQSGVPGQPSGFPYPNKQPTYILYNNLYFNTVYFVAPSTICTTGRSSEEFSKGTAVNIYVQNGTIPESDSFLIPKTDSGLQGTKWLKNRCFRTMGTHYYYNIYQDMDCDVFFPVFLLYDGGSLNAFGFAFLTYLTSPIFEHPTNGSYSLTMSSVPTCLARMPVITTLHVYLTSQPKTIRC